MRGHSLPGRILVVGTAAFAFPWVDAAPAWASNWVVPLYSGSSGEGHSNALPTAPGSPAAACVSSTGKTIKVTWSAVALAATYTVYDTTTSATGTYTSVATGVTTTSWTSGTLATGNYWYEVTAYQGTNWQSPKSSATAETTISSTGTTCKQP